MLASLSLVLGLYSVDDRVPPRRRDRVPPRRRDRVPPGRRDRVPPRRRDRVPPGARYIDLGLSVLDVVLGLYSK